jgi:myo-inositol-1(or 4)-monophosphatase
LREPDDLALLIETAREAGRIACGFIGEDAARWDKPGGEGPVTEADLAVNDHLESALRGARPGYGWLSEETEDDPERLDREKVFIVDPIDGTRSFMDGSRTWAHALAVTENGVPTAAVVYLPQRDLLYHAAAGRGAFLNGTPIGASPRDGLDQAQILAARPAMEATHWDREVPAFKRAYRPSLAYRMALVAQGRFDGMLTLRPSWEWDIAAGALLLQEAGGACSDRRGRALRFNNPHPKLDGVVAGGQAIHAKVLAALRRR